jgi:hypothetical protein
METGGGTYENRNAFQKMEKIKQTGRGGITKNEMPSLLLDENISFIRNALPAPG